MVMTRKSSYRSERDFFYTSAEDVVWISLDIHPWYDGNGDVAGIIIYQNQTDNTPEAENMLGQAI